VAPKGYATSGTLVMSSLPVTILWVTGKGGTKPVTEELCYQWFIGAGGTIPCRGVVLCSTLLVTSMEDIKKETRASLL
jgi:hypothetical protein